MGGRKRRFANPMPANGKSTWNAQPQVTTPYCLVDGQTRQTGFHEQ